MTTLISILVSIAMLFSGGYVTGNPESAACVTLENVALIVNEQTYPIAPSATLGVRTAQDGVLLDFHVNSNGEEMLPTQLRIDEEGVSVLAGDAANAYSVSYESLGLNALLDMPISALAELAGAEAPESLTDTTVNQLLEKIVSGEFVQEVEFSPEVLLASLEQVDMGPATELVTGYVNLIQKAVALQEADQDELNAKIESVMRAAIASGEGEDCTFTLGGEEVQGTKHAATLTMQEYMALADELMLALGDDVHAAYMDYINSVIALALQSESSEENGEAIPQEIPAFESLEDFWAVLTEDEEEVQDITIDFEVYEIAENPDAGKFVMTFHIAGTDLPIAIEMLGDGTNIVDMDMDIEGIRLNMHINSMADDSAVFQLVANQADETSIDFTLAYMPGDSASLTFDVNDPNLIVEMIGIWNAGKALQASLKVDAEDMHFDLVADANLENPSFSGNCTYTFADIESAHGYVDIPGDGTATASYDYNEYVMEEANNGTLKLAPNADGGMTLSVGYYADSMAGGYGVTFDVSTKACEIADKIAAANVTSYASMEELQAGVEALSESLPMNYIMDLMNLQSEPSVAAALAALSGETIEGADVEEEYISDEPVELSFEIPTFEAMPEGYTAQAIEPQGYGDWEYVTITYQNLTTDQYEPDIYITLENTAGSTTNSYTVDGAPTDNVVCVTRQGGLVSATCTYPNGVHANLYYYMDDMTDEQAVAILTSATGME